MGKPSLFWAEPNEIAALLTRLDGPVEGSEAALDTARPTVLSQEPLPQDPGPQEPGPQEPGSPTESTGDAVQDSTQLGLAELWLPETTLEERLQAFFEWLEPTAKAEAMFVADAEGLPLMRQGVEDELVAALATLGGVWSGLRESWTALEDGRLILDFAPERLLHLLAVETRWGWLHLGFVARRRLERPRVDRIRDALVRTVESQGVGSR